jgi:carboxyl-terminal processing protease
MLKELERTSLLARSILAGVILLFSGFAGGYVVGTRFVVNTATGTIQNSTGVPEGVDLSPVWKAWRIIDEKFVPAAVATTSPIATSTAEKDQKRVWGMIEGLANSLNDPYTYFLPPTENQQFNADMSGSFQGVGMEIAVKNQKLIVVSPLKDTPAERAGLKSGDYIMKIDNASTDGMDVSVAVQKIRGPKGTQVTFTVAREGWNSPHEIKVTREVINVPTVKTIARPDGIFVIQLFTFTSNSPDLFRSALREFVQSGDTRLVLDLRGNPGGYLDAAVNMASWFLPAGAIVVTEDYDGHAQNIVHRSYGYNVFNSNLKMIILVDRGSASASEILADALRHYKVAKTVGVNTFGKGSVQELVEITPTTALKVTVARWLGPDGIQIPREGIVPDVKVEFGDKDIRVESDPQLNEAVKMLKAE